MTDTPKTGKSVPNIENANCAKNDMLFPWERWRPSGLELLWQPMRAGTPALPEFSRSSLFVSEMAASAYLTATMYTQNNVRLFPGGFGLPFVQHLQGSREGFESALKNAQAERNSQSVIGHGHPCLPALQQTA